MTRHAFCALGCVFMLFVSFCCTDQRVQTSDAAKNVTFLHVPMVCSAAPSIGCGSRAKFVMLDLMKDPVVEEAWLNRQGTVMAAVWRETSTEANRQHVLQTVFKEHDLEIDLVSEADLAVHTQGFQTREKWYKGAEVDKLSIEEAGVIADRVVTALTVHAKFRNDEDQKAFREETKNIMQRCFLKLKSFDELDEPNRNDTQKEIYLSAIKYIGEEKMPEPQVLREEYEKLSDEECANADKEKDACCSRNTNDGKNGN